MSLLNQPHVCDVMKRFPFFEHSYETGLHKNIHDGYDICLAIPQSKKYYAWFSFFENRNVCFIIDLTREKKPGNVHVVNVMGSDAAHLSMLALGTLLYGSIIQTQDGGGPQYFLIEDMFEYKGIPLSKMLFSEKLGYIQAFLEKGGFLDNQVLFRLPVMWATRGPTQGPSATKGFDIPANISAKITYPIHHIQYRSLNSIAPFLNAFGQTGFSNSPTRPLGISEVPKIDIPVFQGGVPDYSKPQYGFRTVFYTKADLQYDMYRLYAFEPTQKMVYYDFAYIPNYKTSVFMNSIFRTIKENRNLDYIEESDDEDDFQDTRYNKYVDLEKTVLLECMFSRKFKRWIPMKVVQNVPVVHLGKLVDGTRGPMKRPTSARPSESFYRRGKGTTR